MSNIKGFSLVELMVAVGIVGVMSSVAVPKYQKYKVNASRAEAQSSLSSMYTLQQLYYTENDKYGTVAFNYTTSPPSVVTNDIEFPNNSDYKYQYTATPYSTAARGAVSATAAGVFFKGTAVSKKKLGSCAKEVSPGDKDTWCINQDKVLKNDGKAANPCAAGDSKYGGC